MEELRCFHPWNQHVPSRHTQQSRLPPQLCCPSYDKKNICKHIIGVASYFKLYTIPLEIKNLPMGEKRKRGAPKKATKALVRMNDRDTVDNIKLSLKKLKALKQLNTDDGKFAIVNALETTKTIKVMFFLALPSFVLLTLVTHALDGSESVTLLLKLLIFIAKLDFLTISFLNLIRLNQLIINKTTEATTNLVKDRTMLNTLPAEDDPNFVYSSE
ncbi:hypothetical protein BpHYR1_026499 [Brachionus plicatilis]|uniref:SWIM-type domain-containing protein n=1 Tax=Brachionus plicatilis TaxID=10195 RepID=A0A3M7P9Z5_BRAPC|nr:hypothetical protein BpHYR1_026499 [Brachionus plicatilis]